MRRGGRASLACASEGGVRVRARAHLTGRDFMCACAVCVRGGYARAGWGGGGVGGVGALERACGRAGGRGCLLCADEGELLLGGGAGGVEGEDVLQVLDRLLHLAQPRVRLPSARRDA